MSVKQNKINKIHIICEGETDKRFFLHYLDVIGLDREVKWSVVEAGGDSGMSSAIEGFQNEILSAMPSKDIRILVIIVDVDNHNRDQRFTDIKNIIDNSNIGGKNLFEVIQKPYNLSLVSPNKIPVIILIFPTSTTGAIETIFLTAALKQWNKEKELDNFLSGSAVFANQTQAQQDKKKFKMLVERNEKLSLDYDCFWRNLGSYDLKDPAFDEIKNELIDIDKLIP